MNAQISKQKIIEDIDFKELSKTCKTQEDLSSLTKQAKRSRRDVSLKRVYEK